MGPKMVWINLSESLWIHYHGWEGQLNVLWVLAKSVYSAWKKLGLLFWEALCNAVLLLSSKNSDRNIPTPWEDGGVFRMVDCTEVLLIHNQSGQWEGFITRRPFKKIIKTWTVSLSVSLSYIQPDQSDFQKISSYWYSGATLDIYHPPHHEPRRTALLTKFLPKATGE